jgi:hypothetical protein
VTVAVVAVVAVAFVALLLTLPALPENILASMPIQDTPYCANGMVNSRAVLSLP